MSERYWRWAAAAFIVAAIVVLWLMGGRAAWAQEVEAEPPAEVVSAAAEAGVDAVDLHGAMNTVGQPDPKTYLRHAGHLPWPVVPTARITPLGVWDRLASCEAGGNWRAVSPGGRYRGGIQADATFWARYGGLAFAPSADRATREQQIIVAQRGLAVQGPGAWPVCSRRIGMR